MVGSEDAHTKDLEAKAHGSFFASGVFRAKGL
jgi:hypothetical protein